MNSTLVHIAKTTLTYPLLMGENLLERLDELVPNVKQTHRLILISDETVYKLYGASLVQRLAAKGLNIEGLRFPAGEKYKNERTHQKLVHALLQRRCSRDTLILALGGGVVGDLAGYVAATTLRGLSYVQIPTTVLAMVDSSIGGKVGVDTPYGKNLVGAFHHPVAVVADWETLNTLPTKHVTNGLLEALKLFLCSDADAFEKLAELGTHHKIKDGISAPLKELIGKAAALKVEVVQRDEREHGERKILNCGHTVGHAVETLSHYRLPHGFAVGLGMLLEAQIAHELGHLSAVDLAHLATVLKSFGVYAQDLKKYAADDILELILSDKKNQKGEVHMVLLKGIGRVYCPDNLYAHPVSSSTLRTAYHHLLS